VSGADGYPTCIKFNPRDLCLAIGTSDRIVKYYDLQEYELVSTTGVETYYPEAIEFEGSGSFTIVAMEDCVKVY